MLRGRLSVVQVMMNYCRRKKTMTYRCLFARNWSIFEKGRLMTFVKWRNLVEVQKLNKSRPRYIALWLPPTRQKPKVTQCWTATLCSNGYKVGKEIKLH